MYRKTNEGTRRGKGRMKGKWLKFEGGRANAIFFLMIKFV
jgi:hypothetical protein